MRPPFVDTQTNIMYDVNDPEYEGWLTKQSTWLKVRFFPFFWERRVIFLWILVWHECYLVTINDPCDGPADTTFFVVFFMLQEWRRRYFILKGSKLFYCKNEVRQ